MELKEKMITELNSMNIFNTNEFTYVEYVKQLLDFQQYILKQYYKENYHYKLKMGDLLYIYKQDAIRNNIINTTEYKNCEDALAYLTKELAVSASGKHAEDRVNRTLSKYVTREDYQSYLNIYVNNSDDESEIDNVILTKNGFILIEIKGIKESVELSEDGRIIHGNEASYGKAALLRMKDKRRLFRDTLQRVLTKKDYDIDINMDSYLVFSYPKERNCRIYDNYKKENICRFAKLPYIINEYRSDYVYTDDELELLKECMLELQLNTESKTFESKVDMIQIKQDIIEGLSYMENIKYPKVVKQTDNHDARGYIRYILPKLGLALSACAVSVLAGKSFNILPRNTI